LDDNDDHTSVALGMTILEGLHSTYTWGKWRASFHGDDRVLSEDDLHESIKIDGGNIARDEEGGDGVNSGSSGPIAFFTRAMTRNF
jgi:hypothetical protein